MKTYLVTIKTENSIFGKTVKGYDAVLEMVTRPDVLSYVVSKDGKQVSYSEIASAWRHPSRRHKYPPLNLPS